MTDVVYNVYFSHSIAAKSEWMVSSDAWRSLHAEVGTSADFNPLTIKALYITGVVFHLCRSVEILLDERNLTSTTFYPAYGVFASAVELLGRCINGNETNHQTTQDLRTGFKWFVNPSAAGYPAIKDDDIAIATRNYNYSIKELADLRHFSAHGQGALKLVKDFDYLVLENAPPLIGGGIEAYLSQLRSSEPLAMNLALANVKAYRSRPVFDALWQGKAGVAESFPRSMGERISRMDWTYKTLKLR